MAYRRFKIADLDVTPATVAKVATLPAKASQVSQLSHGGCAENTLRGAQTVASVATVAGAQCKKEFFEPKTVATVAGGECEAAKTNETGFVRFVSAATPHFQDFFRCDPSGKWTEADWQDAFEERAAILEYDGGWHRDAAETLARQWIDAQKAQRRLIQ